MTKPGFSRVRTTICPACAFAFVSASALLALSPAGLGCATSR